MRAQSAFTLIELLIVIAIATILLNTAVPGFQAIMQNSRMSAILNEFNGMLALARNTAMTRGESVIICKSSNLHTCTTSGGWEQGWFIFTDPDGNGQCADNDADGYCDSDSGEIIRVRSKLTTLGLTLRATGNPANRIRFDPQGMAQGYAGTFSLCDTRKIVQPKGLVLSRIGRVRPAQASDNVSCNP